MDTLRLVSGSVVLLLLRGLMLWILVPLALIAWPACVGVQLLRRRSVPSPVRCVRWCDSALVALLGNTVLRWAFDPVPWPGTPDFPVDLGGRPFRDLP